MGKYSFKYVDNTYCFKKLKDRPYTKLVSDSLNLKVLEIFLSLEYFLLKPVVPHILSEYGYCILQKFTKTFLQASAVWTLNLPWSIEFCKITLIWLFDYTTNEQLSELKPDKTLDLFYQSSLNLVTCNATLLKSHFNMGVLKFAAYVQNTFF